MAFRAWRDLLGGGRPSPILLPYNGSLDVDNATVRYKGSLVKRMDFDNVDHGGFATFAGLTTAMENFMGILEEKDDGTGNYLPDNTSYGVRLRKVTPCFPSTIILGEYARADAAGTATTDTAATCSAASATFTIDSDTADEWIGGWIYMLTGASAGRLHYIKDSTANTSVTFATAMTKAVVSADTFLTINQPMVRELLFNDTFTGIKSEIAYDLNVHRVVGLNHYIEDVGIPFQPLDRDKHDAITLKNPRFYHAFTVVALSAWADGYAAA